MNKGIYRIAAGVGAAVILVSSATAQAATVTANGTPAPVASDSIAGWPAAPAVTSETAVLIDADTGAVLYDKGMDEYRYPASTTKLMTALTAAGAIYLLWFGVGMLRHPGRIAQENGARADTRKSWWLRGACVSGLNPKVFLLFFALLPQFVRPSLPLSPETQMLVLGAVHLATCTLVYLGVGFGAEFLLRSRASLAVLADVSPASS